MMNYVPVLIMVMMMNDDDDCDNDDNGSNNDEGGSTRRWQLQWRPGSLIRVYLWCMAINNARFKQFLFLFFGRASQSQSTPQLPGLFCTLEAGLCRGLAPVLYTPRTTGCRFGRWSSAGAKRAY